MTEQVTFFNNDTPGIGAIPPQQNPYQSQADGAVKRIFTYDGQVFEDPGPEYSNDDVLKILINTYPDLGNGTWVSNRIPDPAVPGEWLDEVTFVKHTGEKGASAVA